MPLPTQVPRFIVVCQTPSANWGGIHAFRLLAALERPIRRTLDEVRAWCGVRDCPGTLMPLTGHLQHRGRYLG